MSVCGAFGLLSRTPQESGFCCSAKEAEIAAAFSPDDFINEPVEGLNGIPIPEEFCSTTVAPIDHSKILSIRITIAPSA